MATAERRTRLDVDARRAQLVAIGGELFSKRPYDAVWIEEIAAAAGVSRGLLYHYFPTKRDFFVAVIRDQVERVAALTEPDPSLPPLDRLRASLDAHLDYVEDNPHGYLTVHRAAIGADEEVRATLEDSLQAQADRIVLALTPGAAATPALRLAVRSWISFQVTATIQWLEQRQIGRDELRELLADSLAGAVRAAAASDSARAAR